MARRRTTKRVLKPRAPSRVRKTKRAKRKTTRGHQHPELIGLGLVAFGLFLAAVLWAGWNGGYVGGWIGDALQALIGSATCVRSARDCSSSASASCLRSETKAATSGARSAISSGSRSAVQEPHWSAS